jgi:hypothetical protein
LKKHLGQFGKDWVRFVSTTSYAYNTFSSPYLGDYSPYELALGKEPPNVTGYSIETTKGLSQTAETYVNHMKQRFANMGKVILSLQERHQETQRLATAHRLNAMPIYSVGQLVYLYKPDSSSLTANSRKIAAHWCGPLSIYRILDRTHYILATLKGEILTDVFSYNRLKPCFLRTQEKPISNLRELRNILNKNDSKSKEDDSSSTVNVVDEHGDQPSQGEVMQMYYITTDEVDLNEYLERDEVSSLASITELTDDQLERQLCLVIDLSPKGRTF